MYLCIYLFIYFIYNIFLNVHVYVKSVFYITILSYEPAFFLDIFIVGFIMFKQRALQLFYLYNQSAKSLYIMPAKLIWIKQLTFTLFY